MRALILVSTCALLSSSLVVAVVAEQLPARTYTTTDGLTGNVVMGLDVDSRRFLWVSTRDGLSRFDGVHFTTYGVTDGLPTGVVNGILETRAGVYWVETNKGACRFNPRGQRAIETRRLEPLFACLDVGRSSITNRVNLFVDDRHGGLWAGTDGGLFQLESRDGRDSFQPVRLPFVPPDHTAGSVHTGLEDAEGSLWFAADWGVTRLLPDRRAVLYRIRISSSNEAATALAIDSAKRLWIGHAGGVTVLEPDPAASFGELEGPIERILAPPARTIPPDRTGTRSAGGTVVAWYTPADGVPAGGINALFTGIDGSMWIGSNTGLSRHRNGAFSTYTRANGLADDRVNAMVIDGAGNLWVGTQTGLTKVTRNGLVTYGAADGLGPGPVHGLAEDAAGNVFAVTGDHRVNRFEDGRFTSIRPPLPADAAGVWSTAYGYLTRAGEWWMMTTTGLYRFARTAQFAKLADQRPTVFSSRHGLPDDNVARVFEDASGDLWVATTPGGIVRWDRATDAWRTYSEADGLPPLRQALNRASAFAQHGDDIWIGFYEGGVARFRHGRFQSFTGEQGVPYGNVTALHFAKDGRLWVGTAERGLSRVDHPAVDRPAFKTVRTAEALPINIRCVAEDAWGRINAGTSRGVYRIEPASGAVKRFTSSEGLASDFVTAAHRDRQGTIWFGTFNGVSRLDPALDPPSARTGPPPDVLIAAVRVAGVPLSLSELGETAPAAVTLGPSQNHVEIDFFGLSFEPGAALKYQYRLEGSSEDWSGPSELRTVSYARLAPGSYRFSVRAVAADGRASERPAVFAFTALRPIYARWWFVTLAAALVGVVAVAIYRLRVAQLVRVERVRARIATDLHDDIGASLSQIAILSEVVRQRLGDRQNDAVVGEPLARIAESSRELVDAMDDIVWAIAPERDSVSDLVQHMRRFAEDTLGASDVALSVDIDVPSPDVRLGPEVRRDVFLILKESVTNVAKHAASASVHIAFTCDRRRLRLSVRDDGRGFDPAMATEGNGLRNMRKRVAALGGRIDITSSAPGGTTLTLELPLRRSL